MGKPYKSTHIYHITDTYDYRAVGKIEGAYTNYLGKLGIHNVGRSAPTPIDNSIDAGITISEFITNSQRPDRIIAAVNYAPPDNKKGTKDNHRKDFFCAELRNGDVVCGTLMGYEFSYIKPEIKEFFRLTNTNSLGSQFRSLEILPEHTLLFSDPKHRARLISKGILERREDFDRIIPNAPGVTHAHEIDNFKNVKLLPSINDLALLHANEGKTIRFSFGEASIETGTRRPARTDYPGISTPTLFNAGEGKNVIAWRSSSTRISGIEILTNVPMIATLRQRPAETNPDYTPPKVGARVWLKKAPGGLRVA